MNLQDILCGQWSPPKQTTSRKHWIGMSDGRRYTPPTSNKRDSNGMNPTVAMCWEVMQKSQQPMSASEVAAIVSMTRNHCNITLCSLFKDGLLTRRRVHGKGTYHYEYAVKRAKKTI